MNNIIKIILFVAVGLALNQIVNLAYRLASKKSNAIHLRFLKSAINVFVDIIII